MFPSQGTKPTSKQAQRPQPLAPARPTGTTSTGAAIPLPKYVRLAQLVTNVVPMSRATIWRLAKEGKFPAPIKLAPRVTAWKLEEVLAWIEARR